MSNLDWMPEAVRDAERTLADIEELLRRVRADRDRYRQCAQDTGQHVWTDQLEADHQETVKALDRAAHLANDTAKRWRRCAERYGVRA